MPIYLRFLKKYFWKNQKFCKNRKYFGNKNSKKKNWKKKIPLPQKFGGNGGNTTIKLITTGLRLRAFFEKKLSKFDLKCKLFKNLSSIFFKFIFRPWFFLIQRCNVGCAWMKTTTIMRTRINLKIDAIFVLISTYKISLEYCSVLCLTIFVENKF